MILVYFTRQALATVNRAACVTLTMYCLTAINQLVKRKVLTMTDLTYMDCWNYIAPLIPITSDRMTTEIYVMVFQALKEEGQICESLCVDFRR